VGINFTGKDFPGGSLTLLDSRFENTRTGVLLDQNPRKSKEQATLVLLNVEYQNTPVVVDSRVSDTNLNGGTGSVDSWFIGYTYSGDKNDRRTGSFAYGASGGILGVGPHLSKDLLFAGPGTSGTSTSGIYTRSRPQYEDQGNMLVTTAKGKLRCRGTAL
jgi:hypothetical protein